MRRTFLLLLLISLVFSCSGQSEFQLPALIGESDGALINIETRLVPGKGNIYLTVDPTTDSSTQDSLRDAVEYAFVKSNKPITNCDVLVSIDKNDASSVEGPSGGVAFVVSTYAALNNLTIRDDTTITGAVDKYGIVYPVGGLYEKTRGAIANRLSYIITPTLSFHDRILLQPLFSNITVFEINHVDEAINFLFYNKSLQADHFNFTNRPYPNVSSYDLNVSKFKEVSLDIIEFEKTVVDSLSNQGDIGKVKSYLENEISRQNYLIEKGYFFTAANDAFLNYIDASTFLNFDTNPNKKKKEIESCLDTIPKTNKNINNFEYAFGSDLRLSWAKNKLNTTKIEELQLEEEKFFTFNELMYADAWCHVSNSLSAASNDTGEEINESVLKELAQQKFEEAKALNTSNQDFLTHLSSAELSFNNELYGAVIYDTTYVLSMNKADQEIISMSDEELAEALSNFKKEKRSSVWGRIYHSQAFYVSYEDNKTAYTLFVYASDLDKVTNEMKDLFNKYVEENDEKKPNICASILILLAIGGFYSGKLY